MINNINNIPVAAAAAAAAAAACEPFGERADVTASRLLAVAWVIAQKRQAIVMVFSFSSRSVVRGSRIGKLITAWTTWISWWA